LRRDFELVVGGLGEVGRGGGGDEGCEEACHFRYVFTFGDRLYICGVWE